ncbi:MAG: hypothetical protein AAF664_00920, partial [Planctomycetota bacterium]
NSSAPESFSTPKTSPTDAKAEATQERLRGALPINVKQAEGESRQAAWHSWMNDQEIESAEDLAVLDRRVRLTVNRLSKRAQRLQDEGKVEEATDAFRESTEVISAAISAGHVQTWMYHALAISLQAIDADKDQIERALLSAVDFAESVDDLVLVANRLADAECDEAAIDLLKQIVESDPYRREPFVLMLTLAKDLGDDDAIALACEGILGKAWTKENQHIVDKAKLAAKTVHAKWMRAGETAKAKVFSDALVSAASHDVIIRVSWTGEADIDLAIEEPSGTICSLQNSHSAGGGTHLGDTTSETPTDESGVKSETYICSEGFNGQYRLLVRRVYGNATGGTVNLELITDMGRDSQRFIRKEIPLTEKDAMVVFDVKEGKRTEAIAEAQLEELADARRKVRRQVLGQFVNPADNAQVIQNLYEDIATLNGGITPTGPIDPRQLARLRRGAVGFQPQITQLPEGASLITLAIISADRRFVRVSPAPFFSQVGDVTTFNFVTGEEGAGTGGGGFGGGGGGGLGGGGLGGGGAF